ncbi:terminase small subunit [Lederbergia wuyishanensis]|uniref:Phage terminase small subunit n=1 Tax=Lederbergia wuyishanensis TaxID=1347903 RepID=A0ABU0D757_9BACI|nr:terminase small subunit [Lederbergia wuyishanensis]MCJ8008913.1 terminase small subunit [Lederbergia wuyishanensis]MDQ0344239.1 phage terminase small subunit [Lederbergia wuyishanensis]
MPNWEQIRNEWETTKITLAALAEKHDIKLGTLKSRKSRENWSRDATKKDATKTTKVATSIKKDAQKQKEQFEPVVKSDELTDKQRLFCIYYVKSFNQTMAAIKAGYSSDRAHVTGSELVRNRKVADEIKRLKGEMQQGVFIDAVDVLNKYIKIAFADITDYATFGKREVPVIGMYGPVKDEEGRQVTEEVNYVDFNESSIIDGTIVTEVKQGKDGISVKLADKMKALEMLSKYFDLLSENDKKRLQEEKLKAEIAKVKGEDGTEYEDDGFLDAIKSTTGIWDEDDD